MTDRKPYRHRFPLNLIGYVLCLYCRFSPSQRDVQEHLHERGIHVSYETLRQGNIKFASLLTDGLLHREPYWGSRWHLNEKHVVVGGITRRPTHAPALIGMLFAAASAKVGVQGEKNILREITISCKTIPTCSGRSQDGTTTYSVNRLTLPTGG